MNIRSIKFVFIALLNVIVAAGPDFAFAKTPSPALDIKTHRANDAGFKVNSHLIVGKSEIVLIDAQFTRSQAEKVVAKIKKLMGKNLAERKFKMVFLTHAHPDHYFGIETIKKAFPSVPVYARRPVIDEIKATSPGKLAYWKPIYKKDLTDAVKVEEISPFAENSFVVDGNVVNILDFSAGESETSTAFYIPSLKALLSGDLVYNKVHLWLADEHGNPDSWLKTLNELKTKYEIEKVYPGHGPVADAKVLDANIKYIDDFSGALSSAKSKEAAVAAILKAYPKYDLKVIADLSVGAKYKK